MTLAKPPTSSSSTPTSVLISLVRRAMPGILAADLCGVQPMTGPREDPRFKLTGIKQIDDLIFELYRETDRARSWLEDTPLSYGLFREILEPVGSVFAMKIRYAGHPASPTDLYEVWRVEFHDEGEAALFKLTFL